MLGHPVAGVAEPVGEAARDRAVAQRLRAGDAGGDGRQIEDGKRGHASYVGPGRAWQAAAVFGFTNAVPI